MTCIFFSFLRRNLLTQFVGLKEKSLYFSKIPFMVMYEACSSDKSFSSDDLSKPEQPQKEDCCQGGCQNCVFDVYFQALDRWNRAKDGTCLNLRYDLISMTKFKPYVLVNVKKLTVDTNLYTFRPHVEVGGSTSGYLPYASGQHLSLKIEQPKTTKSNDSGSSHVVRDFTIISLSNERNDSSFEVIIKLYEGSLTSKYIGTLMEGSMTYWRGPYGDFHHVPNKYRHLIMFCMGTGIAPMYPIAKEIIQNEMDETMVSLHYGCRNCHEIILREEIENLTSFWNFNCCYYFSEEENFSYKKYREKFILNPIKEEYVFEVLENKTDFYILICGNQTFTDDIKTLLHRRNIDPSRYNIF